MLMSSAEYRESLRRLAPRVFVDGARIESVADAPELAPGINAVGVSYDLALRDELAPIMKLRLLILIFERTRSLVAARPHSPAPLSVLESAHPRRHLLFLGAGQEADVLADADGGARHDGFDYCRPCLAPDRGA